MQSSLLEYYQNNDISLMKEFLLTVPLFNEIHYYLDKEGFYEFVKYVDVQQAEYSMPYELNAETAYMFMCTGILVSKKERRQNIQKFSRLSRTVKFSHIMQSRDFLLTQQNQRQSQKLKTVQPNQLYNQSLLYNPNFTGQSHYFIPNQPTKSIIISINLQKIPEAILTELRQKHNQKLKFISGTVMFKNVQKHIVENGLGRFRILKVVFDQFLMKEGRVRAGCVFFLTEGEVELEIDDPEGRKTYITKAPAIVGVEKVRYVKSVTERCLCFCIEKTDAIDMLKKNMEGKFKNPQTEEQLNLLLRSIGKIKDQSSRHHSKVPSFGQVQQPRQLRSNTSPILQPKVLEQKPNEDNIPIGQSKQILMKMLSYKQKVPQKKKFRIKQHFTNFMSDKYSEFVVRKTQFLKKKSIDEDSVLYEMKTMLPKQPEMSEINKRLRMQRLNKLQKCKQNILQTKQESLNSVNLRIYEEFEDSKIIHKIRRKIQNGIARKQRNNKHWKTYVPDGTAFNRLSDLSLGN